MSTRIPRSDEVKVLKIASVKKEGLIGLFIYVCKYENHKSVLKGTFFRWDSEYGWKKLIEGLENFEKAEFFNLKMLGVDFDYILHRSSKYLLVVDGIKLLTKKVEENKTVDEFLSENEKSTHNNRYETVFEGQYFSEVEPGRWVFGSKKPKKREPKKIIY